MAKPKLKDARVARIHQAIEKVPEPKAPGGRSKKPSPRVRRRATFGLQDRILFAGQQDSVLDYYLAADVFLLTPREDPFPLVNLEALARGLPVIAFADAGGAQEALDGGVGIVVPYLDTAEMTRAVVRLVEAPRFRATISEKALSRAHERYRWDRFFGELRELLAVYLAQPEPLSEGEDEEPPAT